LINLGGASFSDYYDLNVKNLGKGSFGSVVGARDLRTGSLRAVKIVYKPKIENVTRLKREILIM
jgi:calcium-dependent protein kinase